MRHVITLSTIPPRFSQIGPTLRSLVRQRARPEAVELYIPQSYRRFPQWGGALPEVPDGVTIIRVEEDLGPATKILPAAKAYRGQGVELIYGDDDRVFSPAGRGLAWLCAMTTPGRRFAARASALKSATATGLPTRHGLGRLWRLIHMRSWACICVGSSSQFPCRGGKVQG